MFSVNTQCPWAISEAVEPNVDSVLPMPGCQGCQLPAILITHNVFDVVVFQGIVGNLNGRQPITVLLLPTAICLRWWCTSVDGKSLEDSFQKAYSNAWLALLKRKCCAWINLPRRSLT